MRKTIRVCAGYLLDRKSILLVLDLIGQYLKLLTNRIFKHFSEMITHQCLFFFTGWRSFINSQSEKRS